MTYLLLAVRSVRGFCLFLCSGLAPIWLSKQFKKHFVFGFHGHEISEDAKTLIRDYRVGQVSVNEKQNASLLT